MENTSVYFGREDSRFYGKIPGPIGIKHEDRRRHCYVIGKTGTGKTTLLKNLVIQDIRAGRGVGVIDPHGDLINDLLNYIPSHRADDIVYFNPQDIEYPVGLNVLETKKEDLIPQTASTVISIFRDLWIDSWGPRLENILYNAVQTLLYAGNTTFLHIPFILQNDNFRKRAIENLPDPALKYFWEAEYNKYDPRFRKEAIAPVQNKVDQFLTSFYLRNIFGQVKNKIDIRFMMDNNRIFLCNLAKGKIGEDKVKLLGSLIVMKFFISALERIDTPEDERRDFYLYIDEFQNLATNVFASILSEARKYHLNLILIHQYLAQLPKEVKEGVLGNVGTLMCFQVGSEDAESLEKEFYPFPKSRLENLGKHEICLKPLIDGITRQPFTTETFPPIKQQKKEGNKENIIKLSRQKYGMKREVIEDKINRFFAKNT